MRSIPEQRIAEFQEQDYQLYFGFQSWNLTGCSRLCRRLTVRSTNVRPLYQDLHDGQAYSDLDHRYEYRTMESIAKEYEVSLDTIADNIHWVERTLLNADILQTSVTCVYKTN